MLNDDYIIDDVIDTDYINFRKLYLQLENTIDFTEEKFINICNIVKEKNNKLICIRNKKNNDIIATASFVCIDKFGNNKGIIEDVVVDSKYRNKNFGTYLVENLKRYAKQRDCYKVYIIIKEHTKNFYNKLGFADDGRLLVSCYYDIHL